MTPERMATLQEVMAGCLDHAALFRRWLTDGDNTTIVREEHDGLIAMIEQIFHEIVTGRRDTRTKRLMDDAYAGLCARHAPPLP